MKRNKQPIDLMAAILGDNFRRSTEWIIDGNSIVYEHKIFYFLFYIYEL